jgi:ATP-dependent Lhr-like helicase
MTDSGVAGMDAFARLGREVRDALSERGFETPTEPQRRAIPPLAEGRDALVVAPTGTGKTETAMLPVLDAIVSGDADGDRDGAGTPFGVSALYVTPLRALNRDMRDRLEWWGDRLGVEVDVRHGDTSDYRRSQQADDPPDVLVTTPETLQAILTGEKLRRALADVSHVVIDEVHELAASKRGAQLTVGLERLRDLAGPFQRIGLSATVGDPEEVGRFLTGDRGCELVAAEAASDVDVQIVRPEVTDADERLAAELATDGETASHVRAIRDIVREHESTLIFVNTRQTAEALGARFGRLDEPIGIHHGSLSTDARLTVEERFKSGEIDGLVCTSSMELGIDVGRVDHVVQYNSPREVARLLQRVGRAGHRRGRTSHGTVVTGGPEDTLEALAIARRAERGDVEPAAIHHGSLDVVANQVVGTVMDRGDIRARRAYDLVTSAYPFRDLTEDEFRAVARELDGNRVLWLDEDADRLEKSGGTWQYYYRNLSMIPDEETYEVRDVSARETVGTLDERFVRTFAEPGATFVQRGELWRVTEVDDEESQVDVSPVDDPGGEVPSWTGREIPVPAAVAGDVGDLRDVAAAQFAAGADRAAVARDVAPRYPADERTLRTALAGVERQVEADHPVPTADRLVLESEGRTAVLNAPYGHEVNETIGRLVAALVGQQTGSSVGMDADPYRIEFELPRRASVGDVLDALETTDPGHVEPILELALKSSDALKFTLAHVAATFGRLKRYRGDGRMGGDRLLAALEDTPVFDEAVREVFHEDLAVEATSTLLDRIQAGDVAVVTARERTPIGREGRSSGGERLVPENADAGVIETVRERIQGDRIRLLCLHCADWERTKQVGRVRDQPRCPDCESTRVAALNPWDEETSTAVRADAADRDEAAERRVERAYRSAGLVQSHGKRAVVAMAGRGVGPETAARIIRKHRPDEDGFYRDILEQERRYARTQSFWD